ncbi:tryptophan 7-halogenase [Sphingomonas arenae]|uniref:tryptophan 7-halogenase n=1 Tax=Sphingomonas arenae TaxID=2812555 RepID=UPI0019683205|nr:tryptophan 7-halogenase [Sphingomonas arenae]
MSAARKLIVIGDGVAGALTAAVLARALANTGFEVHLVGTGGEDTSVGPSTMVLTTRPGMARLHRMIGLDDERLVQSAGASFTLGSAWSGWSSVRPTYFVPFGGAGAKLHGVSFHQLAARLRATGQDLRFGDYTAAPMMAQSGRFALPPADPSNPLAELEHGLHLPAREYRAVLLQRATAFGAQHSRTTYDGVEFAPDGSISVVRLADGSRHDAHLVVDASGIERAVVRQVEDMEWQDWSGLLPCNTWVETMQATNAAPPLYSHVEALPTGWRMTVPTQGRAVQLFASSGSADLDPRPGSTVMNAGRLAEPWVGNCVAIGAAAATLDPVHALPLDLVRSALERLLRLLPGTLPASSEAREYNRETIAELDRSRDLAMVAYRLNARSGESFWDSRRAGEVPEELGHKLALYESRGRVSLLDGDLLDEDEWALLFDELGLRPRRYDSIADAIPVEHLQRQFARMRELTITAIRPLPTHGEYLSAIRRSAAA